MRNGATSVWTAEAEAALRDARTGGKVLSFSQIAALPIFARLGVTRNAIIGKAKRMGLLSEGRPRGAIYAGLATRIRFRRNSATAKTLPPAPPAPVEPRNISLLDLGPRDCRFPTKSEGGKHYFCGCERRENSSYCSYHHRVAWRQKTNLQESSQKWLARRAA